MRFLSPVVRTTRTLQHTVRDLNRLREVAVVLVRYGLDALLAGVNIPGVRLKRETLQTTPERLVQALQELGPTFIKFGQVMSTRVDIVPPGYIQALQTLQDAVLPFPFHDVEDQLVSSYGAAWRERVPDLNEVPIATGSIAQVHEARLATGQEVVLKILRPRIRETIKADMSILTLLAHRLVIEFPEASYFEPVGILKEFERSIGMETDLLREAEHTERFRRNFQDQPDIVIPRVFHDLSTQDILVLERIRGVRIRDAREAGHDMKIVGKSYLKAAYRMIFEDAFFHGDLHPGNVFVLPDNRLALLDFGMVGRLTPEMKDNLVAIFFALERGDFRSISRIYYDLGIKVGRVDYDAFESDVIDLMERNWVGRSVREIEMGAFMRDLADGAIRYRIRAPADYTMFFKAVLTTEGLAKAIIPEVDPISEATPFVDHLVKDRFRPDRMQDELFYQFITLRSLGRRIPTALTQFLDDVQEQRITFHVVTEVDVTQRRMEQNRQTQLLTAAMSIASLIAGTVALDMPAPWWLVLLGIPYLSFLFYLSSMVFWLWTLVMMYRNRKG